MSDRLLGRNLNQIAKVLNTSPQNRTAFRVEVITELSRVIRSHTDKVSDVLRGTVERWQLR
jgi:1,4-dihydroxy-2-naphthoyl-CoA synthase